MNVAVVDSGGNLVAFQRMDGAMLASIQIAEHKARAAATFRRETKQFEDGIQLMHLNYLLAFDGIIASRGGIPLIEQGVQHQTPRQHQPAAGRRARRRVGCVHRFARAIRRPGWDQGADGARLPQAGRCRKSARILPGPNRALGRARRDSQLRDVEDGRRSKPILADMFPKSVVIFYILCALYRKEPSMNAVQVEQKSYEMPPREGITVAHFLTVADVERSARYYEKVFGARILTMGDGNAPPYLQLANIWMILNVGGGPTPDKPTVTLSVPDPNHINSFMNFRVADIQACYELWKSRGAEFLTPPIPKYGEIRCYIRDPDGYIIEVGQSTDLTYG